MSMSPRTRGIAFTALALVAALAPAGMAGAADGTWQRAWGTDIVTGGSTGFEICMVAANCKNGSAGGLGAELSTPRGVAVDAVGNVYVADLGNERIQKFDSSGNFLRAWGKDVVTGGGTGLEVCTVAADCKQGVFGGGLGGELSSPQDVAVDAAGDVYVAEGQRIQKFDSDGNWERAWGKDVLTAGGTGIEVCTVATDCKLGDLNGDLGGEFRGPNGVAVDAAGDVYVADEVRQRIQKFDSNGTWERAWGDDVVQEDQPGDVDPDGFEVCTTAADCKTGVEGTLGGEFDNPRRVAVDEAGDVYVGDIENQRIQKFGSDGAWERAWGKDVVTGGGTGFEVCTVAANCKLGATGGLGGEFVNPIGVATDGAGDVYVADRDNMRIQRFGPTGTWKRAWGLDVVTGGITGYEVCIVAADCKSGALGLGRGGEVSQPDGVGADAAGNLYATPTSQRVDKFVEAAPPAPPLIPPGAPPGTTPPATTSAQAELPPPQAGKNVNVSVVRGVVRIRQPGQRSFRRLVGEDQIRMGSLIDTTKGRVRLTSAAGGGRTQTADFYDGLFKVTQTRGRRPVTDLRLSGRLAGCRGKATVAARRKGRRLWGKGRGRFRTRGRRSSALVRGTWWLVEDRCDSSTRTRVRQGVVRVRDFARKRNVTVRAGGSYVARPR